MCDHIRTEIIARRDGVDYLECLDCRQVFEAEDLEPVPADEKKKSSSAFSSARGSCASGVASLCW